MATNKPFASTTLTAALASGLFVLGMNSARAAPPIRTGERNQVPACVTPERLMAFLADRNPKVDPRYREIARWYKYYGEGWRVRWDYAFFQMAIETNFLSYRRGDGRPGDVRESQNNFAGIGATGGGVRGERFPDVKTGVHAQIQHLVAYSGERLAVPVAKRTRENQDDIIAISNRLGRPVTFGDLARRWATDRAYAKSIDFIANLYMTRYCEQPARAAETATPPPSPLQMRREWRYPFRPPSGLGGPVPDDDKSAGGETLPWAAKPKKPAVRSHHDKPAAVSPKKPTLKTTTHGTKISKTKKVAQKSKKLPVAAAPGTATSGTWAATTETHHEASEQPAADASAPETRPVAAVAEQTQSTSYLPWLPTFHIAPSTPEPSRLGGPIASELGDAAKAAAEAPAGPCRVLTASYGGSKTLLIRSKSGEQVVYTALTIIEGFEKSMFDAYARTEASGAEIVGEYGSPESALIDARVNCPDG